MPQKENIKIHISSLLIDQKVLSDPELRLTIIQNLSLSVQFTHTHSKLVQQLLLCQLPALPAPLPFTAWRTSIRNREAEQAATMHHWCLSKAAQAAATTGQLFKVSALKLRILPPIQLSMKTFISYNQLQNKSLRQIMFFLHFSSPPSPLNTKCPCFKKKNSRRNSLLFYLSLCLCPSYVVKILSRRFKDVC